MAHTIAARTAWNRNSRWNLEIQEIVLCAQQRFRSQRASALIRYPDPSREDTSSPLCPSPRSISKGIPHGRRHRPPAFRDHRAHELVGACQVRSPREALSEHASNHAW
jgi:hypothetical protein